MEAKADEQAFAVLARIRIQHAIPQAAIQEWSNLFRGVANNQPELLAEWRSNTPNDVRRTLREAFGKGGELARVQGWGVFNIGPLTDRLVFRFLAKLGRALYYRHMGALFEGGLFIHHLDQARLQTVPDYVGMIEKLAPGFALPSRNNKPLTDQFLYRFGCNARFGAMFAVLEFNEQMRFQILAMRSDLLAEYNRMVDEGHTPLPKYGWYECRLKYPPQTGADHPLATCLPLKQRQPTW